MKRSVLLFGLVVVTAACTAEMKDGGDTATAAGTVVATAPTPITYADVAGKWSMNVMPEVGDSVLLTYEVVATADTGGWNFTFPGRSPIPIHVMPPTADSIVTHAGPYESGIRKGMQVTTTNVLRLRDGKLLGSAVATYKTAKGDSVVRLRAEGTRM